MTFLAGDSPVQKITTTILGSSAELLVQRCETLSQIFWGIADEAGCAEAGAYEVDDDSCTRHRYQSREITNGQDFEELRKWISGFLASVHNNY